LCRVLHPVEQIADEILVIDALNGDCEAFDRLVSRWQKRLWRHALNLTGLTGAAWDISQESWLDIIRGLTRLNDQAKFGPWAYRIAGFSAPARMVLNLYYLEGFSLCEIAGILETPEGTVKSRLHAARIEFRDHCEPLGRKVTT